MKILLVEDDEVLCEILQTVLQKEGFIVQMTVDGGEGLYLAENFHPDAMILDVGLPTLDGISLLKIIREKGLTLPVLLLTEKGEVADRIHGLNAGADDFLPKPFDYGELVARVRAIIRRSKGVASSKLEMEDMEIDMAARTVRRGGQPIALTAKEFNLLEYLAIHVNRVVSRTELFEHLYNEEFESNSNVIDVYVKFLRNKIDVPYPVKLIQTVRGAGYVLRVGPNITCTDDEHIVV